MAVALPFVGAAVGWLAGGTAMWAQVGWMVGSMIYSAVQPAPTMSAGNPATAPSVGSDIRGQNLPVIFGTVRCSGYLIWQANFKSSKNTRKVGSGKKKSKQEYYSYSWDLLFHMGHATVPYRVVGIWEGSERIQDDSLDNITFADGSTFQAAAKLDQQENILGIIGAGFWGLAIGANRFRALQSTQAAKSAEWGEAYFYGAHATTAAENGWAYFQAQTGATDVRWPHSLWIGFKQFQLGEQPRIPQLNFEVTPDQEPDMNTAFDGTAISQEWNSSNTTDTVGSFSRTPSGVTAGGNQVIFTTARGPGTPDALIYIKHTRSPVEILYTLAQAQAAQAGVGSPYTGSEFMSDNTYVGSLMIPGTNDLAMIFGGAYTSHPDPNEQFNLICTFEIGEDGSVTALGYAFWNFNLPIELISGVYAVCLNEDQDTLYVFGQISNSGEPCMYVMPNPRFGSTVNQGSNVPSGLGGGMLSSILTYEHLNANMDNAGFMLPMANGNIRFYFYLTRARAQYSIDNAPTGDDEIDALAPTWPNGGMFAIEFNSAGTYVAGPSDVSGDFDQNGPPFDNEGENNDGNTVSDDSQGYRERIYAGPTQLGIRNSPWIVMFQRDVSAEGVVNSLTGSYASFRVFQFDPKTGDFEQIRNEVGFEMEDTVQAYNEIALNRYTGGLSYRAMSMLYAPLTGEFFRAGQRADGSRVYDFVTRIGRVRAGIVDLTPPEIIREIFTNEVIGFGKSTSLIDTTTYDEAVAYCEEHGIKISVIYPAAAERISIFEALVNVYGGWVAWDGYKLKFGKPTDVFSPVGEIDNSFYYQENPDDPKPPFNGRRQALQDTANKITVKFFDRLLAYRQNEITLGDEVDQDLNGIRHKQLVTGFIMDRNTAYRLCERMLWGNMYARNIYSDVLLGWKGSKYEPGDLITLVDSFSNTNISARMVRREEIKRGVFKCTFVEELDYLGKSRPVIETPRPGVRGLPTTTERPLDFDAYELPYEFQKEGPTYYVGYAPGGPTAAAGLYTSPSTTDFRLYGQALPFPDAGRVLSHFPATENVMTNVRVVVNAKSSSNVNSIPTWFEGEIEDFTSFDRALGLSTFRVGSEMMAYEGATLVGSNIYELTRVYRGYGGTQIQAHSPGDVWWLHDPRDGGGMWAVPYAADQIGTEFYYKVVPVGFDGVEYDPSSIPAKRYQITGDHFTPRAVDRSDVRIYVGSDSTIPASLGNQYGPLAGSSLSYINPFFARNVGSSDERNIMAHWPEMAQATGFGAQGYGAVPYGNFQADLNPVSWLVSIVGSGNAVVRSVTVTTPGYAYSALDNVSDNGAWRGNVAISIRPYNAYGFSPYAAVVSLQLSGS